MQRKILTALIMSGIAASILGGYEVQASNVTTLDEVVVNSDKYRNNANDDVAKSTLPGGYTQTEGDFGYTGKKSTMDVPYTQVNLSRKTMETFGENAGKPFAAMLSTVPGVRNTATALHSDYYIRGIKLNGTSLTLNGVPLMFTQFSTPTFMIDHINVLEGPNLGVSGTAPTYESTPAAGVVNMVSKKATEAPITSYKQVFSGKSGFAEYLDVGRRFGKDNSWGIRVNTEVQDGNPTQYDAHIRARGIYVNIDHKSDKSNTNFLIGERLYRVDNGGRWFKFVQSKKYRSGIRFLPSAPDSSNGYGYEGMSKRNRDFEMILNHEQKFNEHVSAFVNGGYNFNHMYRNAAPASSRFWIYNDQGLLGDGNGTAGGYNSETPQHCYYFQGGFKFDYDIGNVKNNTIVSLDRSYVYMDNGRLGKYITYKAGEGTLNTGFSGVPNVPIPEYSYYRRTVNRYKGWSVIDNLSYGKAEFMVGFHRHDASVNTKKQDGSYDKSVNSHATMPTYGFTYKPNDNMSVYYGHSEYFDQGTAVSGMAGNGKPYLNDGDVIAPAKTKMDEIGFKYLKNGTLNTLSFFETKQAQTLDVWSDKSNGWYKWNAGQQKYRGVEWTIQGKIAPKWNVLGGLMYEKATREKGISDANGLSLNGKKIQPSWHATAALEYNPNEQWAILGRVEYTGSSDMYPFMDTDNSVKFRVPSYTTFDLGASYNTKIGGVKTTFTLMIDNLFNKDYWVLYNTNDLHLSDPRTVWLSAKFEF